MSPGAIAGVTVLAALVAYSILATGYEKKSSVAAFPSYRQLTDEGASEHAWKGLLVIFGWMGICAGLAYSGHEVLTAAFWSGSIVVYLAWRLYPLFFSKRCPCCGNAMETFRETGTPIGPAVSYLYVCHACKTVQKDKVFDVVDP